MKKIFLCLIFLALLFTTFSCSTMKPNESSVAQIPQVLGKYGIPRPDWVYMDISTQDVHYVAAYGKMSTTQNSIKRAQAEAKNLLAEWVSTSVEEIIVTYVNDAGSDANRQAMDAFESISKQKATAILSGTKQEDIWEDAEGGVWVLMSIPVENVASQMYGAVSEAIDSSSKQFQTNAAAKAANDMLTAAVDKYFTESPAQN